MPWSSSQMLELLVVLCTAYNLRHFAYKVRNAFALANSKGGSVRPDSMPTQLSILIGPVQGLVYLNVPIVYIVTLVSCGMRQPVWMNAFALPDAVYGVTAEGAWRNATRVLACVADLALQRLTDQAFEHLDDQFHPLGRREKGKVVQTGPYAWVRHPMYTNMLLQFPLFALIFWSYAPLLMIVPTIVVFTIKIPMEEEAIQRDEATREEYRAYMERVPARLIPYVW